MMAQPHPQSPVTHEVCNARRDRTATWLRWIITILSGLLVGLIASSWTFAQNVAITNARQDAQILTLERDRGEIIKQLERIGDALDRLNQRLPVLKDWRDNSPGNL